MKIFTIFLLLFSISVHSQHYIFGKITNEDAVELKQVTIINLNTEERAFSDNSGYYMIRAEVGQEIRFIASRFERTSFKISQNHFTKPLNIVLKQIPQEIEEVKIGYRVTGDLKEDTKHFGNRGKVKKIQDDVANYISQKSAPIVMTAKPGEFVQPVGPGFSIGKVRNKWDDIDFSNFLEKELGEAFFIEDLKIEKPQIQHFIRYIFQDFDRKEILKYGRPKNSDISRFMSIAIRKIEDYKTNKPNFPKKNKKLK